MGLLVAHLVRTPTSLWLARADIPVRVKTWTNIWRCPWEKSQYNTRNSSRLLSVVPSFPDQPKSSITGGPKSTQQPQTLKSTLVSHLQCFSLCFGCKSSPFALREPFSEYECSHSCCVAVVWVTYVMSDSLTTVLNRWRKRIGDAWIQGNAAVYFPPVLELLCDKYASTSFSHLHLVMAWLKVKCSPTRLLKVKLLIYYF